MIASSIVKRGAIAASAIVLSALTYFQPWEFAQKNDDEGETAYLFNSHTAVLLDSSRHIAGVPFVLNSAVRTPDYNESVGGALLSSHTAPCYCGVDISTPNGRNRDVIVKALKQAGFIRIIIYPNHIHADTDSSKTTWGVWHSKYK